MTNQQPIPFRAALPVVSGSLLMQGFTVVAAILYGWASMQGFWAFGTHISGSNEAAKLASLSPAPPPNAYP